MHKTFVATGFRISTCREKNIEITSAVAACLFHVFRLEKLAVDVVDNITLLQNVTIMEATLPFSHRSADILH